MYGKMLGNLENTLTELTVPVETYCTVRIQAPNALFGNLHQIFAWKVLIIFLSKPYDRLTVKKVSFSAVLKKNKTWT